MVLQFGQHMRRLTVAAFAAASVFVLSLPAQADDNVQARALSAKRTTQSLTTSSQPTLAGVAGNRNTGFANGFLYFPGAQPGLTVGGRVPLGKSHVYVPYYGNVSGDPAHPSVQGTAGIAYGFRTWDISVVNGGVANTQQLLPGVDAPKANPALSLSIRF